MFARQKMAVKLSLLFCVSLSSFSLFGSNITLDKQVKKIISSDDKQKQCSIKIYGTDQMQYKDAIGSQGQKLSKVVVPHFCETFTFDFAYDGKLPASIMGHNIIVTKKSDRADVLNDAMSQGRIKGFIPAASNKKVLAASLHTLGGGASDKKKEEVVLQTKKFNGTDEYILFCSFTGHCTMMTAKLVFEAKPVQKKVKLKEAKKEKVKTQVGKVKVVKKSVVLKNKKPKVKV